MSLSKSDGDALNLLAGEPLVKRRQAREGGPQMLGGRRSGRISRSRHPRSDFPDQPLPFLNGLAGVIPNRHGDKTQFAREREPVVNPFDVSSLWASGWPCPQEKLALLGAKTPELCPRSGRRPPRARRAEKAVETATRSGQTARQMISFVIVISGCCFELIIDAGNEVADTS